MEELRKPPLGVMPRHIWIEKRRRELVRAITEYMEANQSLPHEWVLELNDLNAGLYDGD